MNDKAKSENAERHYSSDPAAIKRRRLVKWLYECPKCGAKPNAKCVGSRGRQRTTSHRERWITMNAAGQEQKNMNETAAGHVWEERPGYPTRCSVCKTARAFGDGRNLKCEPWPPVRSKTS